MKRIFVRSLVGVWLGIGFALFEFAFWWAANQVSHNHATEPMRSIVRGFDIVNIPAIWMGHIWIDVLRLPPHGEVAWVVVPVVTILLQWSFIGWLGGLLWGFRSAAIVKEGGIWPIVLWGTGTIVICLLLTLALGFMFSQPKGVATPTRSPKRTATSHEPNDISKAIVAVDAAPSDPNVRYQLGVAYANHGRHADAISQFRKVLYIKPDYAEAHYQMGLSLAASGRLEEAIKAYRQAIMIRSDYEEAKQNLKKAIELKQALPE